MQIKSGNFTSRDVKKRSSKKKSPVWSDIKQIVDCNGNDITGFFSCNTCKEVIENQSYEKHGTTTPFTRHDCKKAKNQTSIEQFATASKTHQQRKTKISQQHQQKLREGCVQYVCNDLRPYYAVEGKGLRELVYACMLIGQAYPHLSREEFDENFPKRSTVQREVQPRVQIAKEEMKSKLQDAYEKNGGFACTADLWTDRFRQRTYLSLTGHISCLSDTGTNTLHFITVYKKRCEFGDELHITKTCVQYVL